MATLVAAIAVGLKTERHVYARVIAAAKDRWPRAIATTAALHVAALVLFAVPGFVALGLADTAGIAAAAVVALPAAAVLGGLAFALTPSEVDPKMVVNDLVKAGASRPTARAIAITSAPFAVVELGVAVGTVIAVVVA